MTLSATFGDQDNFHYFISSPKKCKNQRSTILISSIINGVISLPVGSSNTFNAEKKRRWDNNRGTNKHTVGKFSSTDPYDSCDPSANP